MKRHVLSSVFFCLLLLIVFAADAHAMLVPMDFEGLPLDYYTYDAHAAPPPHDPNCVNEDHLNLGHYYPGVYFGPDVTINDKDIYGYNWQVYPPMSGSAVIVSRLIGGAEIIFDTPTTYFEGWFTHMNGYGLNIYAYDTSGVEVDMAHISYWDAHLARLYRMEMVKISLSAPTIKRVYIGGYPNCWAADNIAYEGNGGVIPEPTSMLLFGLCGMGVAFLNKAKKEKGNKKR